MEAAGWMGSVEFPATKEDLIDAAASADAPQEVVERLQRLEQERYDTRDEVEAELRGD
jgi:Protein of unknown function (DUF2795)